MTPTNWPPPTSTVSAAEAHLAKESDLVDLALWKTMVHARPGIRVESRATYFVHSAPFPTESLNELRVLEAVPDVEEVLRHAASFFSEASPRWCVVVPSALRNVWGPRLRGRDWTPVADRPVLVRSTGNLSVPLRSTEFSIRRVEDFETLRVFQRTFSSGNEMPDSGFWMSRGLLDLATLDLLLAEQDGVPCATAIGQTEGTGTGIYGVATLPDYRGKGIGAAITWAAIERGAARGAKFAYLWSTELGFPVYQRLGFRHVENRAMWVYLAA